MLELGGKPCSQALIPGLLGSPCSKPCIVLNCPKLDWSGCRLVVRQVNTCRIIPNQMKLHSLLRRDSQELMNWLPEI